jgi:uncharacterized protein (TIGR02598 family)
MQSTRRPALSAGFSLIEITLSIGIIAFAFVALLGLLPTGMAVFRDAMDTSVTAQISQRIAGEIQETEFSSLLSQCKPDLSLFKPGTEDQSGVLPTRYFDDQGNEISVGNAASPSAVERRKIIYDAYIRVSRAARLPSGSKEAAVREPSGNLVTVNIQVVNNPGGHSIVLDANQLVDPAQSALRVRSYASLIARTGAK